jgi:cellulose synthase/poly-beta-1,6-N-acetylglucosamine synthase-like glycosyltransferase
MTGLEVDLSALFVLAVILIWFMIAYQFVLTVFGYINYVRSLREKVRIDGGDFQLPSCTILVPAHNEEKVIRRTLEALCSLDYPSERLTILIVNDASTDATGEIVQLAGAKDPRVRLLTIPPAEGGRGKSRALNVALRQVTSDVVAVYDADNTPVPSALRYLVAQLLLFPELGAALGKFRTVNRDATLLTRFINIETLSFQSILQAGRWQMHSIATLPGTNFVVWTRVLRELNGWDEQALTEDSELSIRIYQLGYLIKYIPYAVTFEQEPQMWGVWVRQRMRWVRGNNYVIAKFLREIPGFRSKRLAFDLLYTLSLYYLFFFAIVVSLLLFVLSAANLVNIALPGPYTLVWMMAFVLFSGEIYLALSYDGEDSAANALLIALMYFTYCQLWIYVVLKAWYTEVTSRGDRVWDKTERVDPDGERRQHAG